MGDGSLPLNARILQVVLCASPVTSLPSTATQRIICSQSKNENMKQSIIISFLQNLDVLDDLLPLFFFSYLEQQLFSASFHWNTGWVKNIKINQQFQLLSLNTHATDF